ncbi:MAG: AAA family ATPase [Planctomycetes bacterium]|nr:AAA family ATPase [Planctomycetota bacterium]
MNANERFNEPAENADTGRLAVVSLADVEPERVQWLWPGRLPLRKLSLIAGQQGLGKSFLTLDLASRVSTGTPWPDALDDHNPQGNVILLSAEDALADTVRPRLDWAGANVDRIKAIEGVAEVDHTGQRSFDLQRDIYLLSEAVEEIGEVRLIVFDPIDSYLGQNVNPNRGNDIRRVLGPLAELAEHSGAAVVAVAHLNKSPNPNALYRVCGSIAYPTPTREIDIRNRLDRVNDKIQQIAWGHNALGAADRMAELVDEQRRLRGALAKAGGKHQTARHVPTGKRRESEGSQP